MGISEMKAISTRMSECDAKQSIESEQRSSNMKTKTSVKSGGYKWNHSQTAVGVKVKTSIKSGAGTQIPIKVKHNL